MSRKAAREIALHTIFELGFKEFYNYEAAEARLDKEYMSSLEGEFELYSVDIDDVQRQYIKDIVKGVALNIGPIDDLIKEYSKNWNMNRISKMSLSILRVAIYEIKYTDTDDPVIANEAVEFAKKYESKESSAFINGILGSVIMGKRDA